MASILQCTIQNSGQILVDYNTGDHHRQGHSWCSNRQEAIFIQRLQRWLPFGIQAPWNLPFHPCGNLAWVTNVDVLGMGWAEIVNTGETVRFTWAKGEGDLRREGRAAKFGWLLERRLELTPIPYLEFPNISLLKWFFPLLSLIVLSNSRIRSRIVKIGWSRAEQKQ